MNKIPTKFQKKLIFSTKPLLWVKVEEEQTRAVLCANSPFLWHGEPILMFTVTLGVLLHGGTGIGNKCLLHGLADSQAQKLMRPGQPSLPRRSHT